VLTATDDIADELRTVAREANAAVQSANEAARTHGPGS